MQFTNLAKYKWINVHNLIKIKQTLDLGICTAKFSQKSQMHVNTVKLRVSTGKKN